jgi:hypothetical protein
MQPPVNSTTACNGNCKVVVTVSDQGCANPGSITAAPDPLSVKKNFPNQIFWEIQTPGYTFVAPPPPPPGGISGLPDPPFDHPHLAGNGTKYDIHDNNPETKDFKYGIHLLDAHGNPCWVLDPTIRNGQ